MTLAELYEQRATEARERQQRKGWRPFSAADAAAGAAHRAERDRETRERLTAACRRRLDADRRSQGRRHARGRSAAFRDLAPADAPSGRAPFTAGVAGDRRASAVAGGEAATSLETQQTSCTKKDQRDHPALNTRFSAREDGSFGSRPDGRPLYADSPGAHALRWAVAEHLAATWPARSASLRSCGYLALKLDCAACAAPHIVPLRCGARTCPTCQRRAAGAVAGRVARRVERLRAQAPSWDVAGPAQRLSWRHVVLTTPAPLDLESRYHRPTMREAVRRVRRAWGRFWRSTPWGRQRNALIDGRRRKRARRDTAYATGLEISPRGMVHIHALVFGEYVSQRDLAHLWADAYRAAAGEGVGFERGARIVWVERVRGDDATGIAAALREALKYATKGEKGARRAERAAVVESALRGVRRVDVGGALRLHSADVGDDVTQQDLHAAGALGCEDCGSQVWRAPVICSPTLVALNRGFGRLWTPDEAPPPHDFYGGDPPPWFTDPPDDSLSLFTDTVGALAAGVQPHLLASHIEP